MTVNETIRCEFILTLFTFAIYQLGVYKKALKCFERQAKLYPLMLNSWKAVMLTQKKLGFNREAEDSWDRILQILKMKNISPKMMPLLFDNIKYDMQSSKFSEKEVGNL